MELSKDFLINIFITNPVGGLEDVKYTEKLGEKLLEELEWKM